MDGNVKYGVGIKVDVDTRLALEKIRRMDRRMFERVIKGAVNDTAYSTREHIQKFMKRVFHRPVSWTLRSVRFQKMKTMRDTASVYINDDQLKYLKVQVTGGIRPHKQSERRLHASGDLASGRVAVPTRYATDSRGNFKKSMRFKVIDALVQNDKSSPYFAITESGRHLKPGVYRRMARNKLRPVMVDSSSATYRALFPFHRVALRYINRRLPRQLNRWMEFQLKRAGVKK